MVVAGAAGDSKGTRDFNDKIGGKMISALPVRVDLRFRATCREQAAAACKS